MKIVGKVKDYFDYLQGVWGMDEKRTLDRTVFTKLELTETSNEQPLSFYIGDWLYQGYFRKGRFYYGNEELNEIAEDEEKGGGYYWYARQEKMKEYRLIYDRSSNPSRPHWVAKFPIFLGEESPTNALNCPILCSAKVGFWYTNENLPTNIIQHEKVWYAKNPILKDVDLPRYLPAQKIWEILIDWLGKEKVIPNTQTDKEKIVGAGFDLKTSFRKDKQEKK